MISGGVAAWENSNITCQNSILSVARYSDCHFDIQNCVLLGGYDMKYSSIKNSIIDWTGSSWSLDASSTSSHCLVLNDASGFADSWYVDSWENIIVDNPRYEYEKYASLYQLTESAASTYLGIDGTQVGIYGGPYPFDISVTNPMIGHCSAARRTNAEGKLEVDIEVINE